METKIIIAIDGYSGCGKSTLAKQLAQHLNYIFIDTGAMYRATTLYFLRTKVDFQDSEQVDRALSELNITFKQEDGQTYTYLNKENVESEIREMYVSENVSQVSTISAVRRAMVKQQQAMGTAKGVVLDGRDIGTVVFPDAELKLFMTANPDVRAKRRLQELEQKGKQANFESVKQNLLERDRIDSGRADSPLRKAKDAIEIDTSNITREEQFERALGLVQDALKVSIS